MSRKIKKSQSLCLFELFFDWNVCLNLIFTLEKTVKSGMLSQSYTERRA